MLVHIADAPPHANAYAKMLLEMQAAASHNTVIFPVAASGTDPDVEYIMRNMAQVSGGRYIFLTNDSGIGNDHIAPTVTCYFVEKLNAVLLRTITDEIKGTSSAPDPNAIVRTVGDVHGTACTFDGNQTPYFTDVADACRALLSDNWLQITRAVDCHRFRVRLGALHRDQVLPSRP